MFYRQTISGSTVNYMVVDLQFSYMSSCKSLWHQIWYIMWIVQFF